MRSWRRPRCRRGGVLRVLPRESAREVDYTWTRLVPMQPSPAGRAAELAFSGTAVVSADDPWRLHVSDGGSVEQCPEHPRRRSLVTAGKRGQPPARDAGPDLEPKATVLLCRVDPEAASASSGRFVAAPGRPQRKRFTTGSRLPLSRLGRLLGAPLRANADASTRESDRSPFIGPPAVRAGGLTLTAE